MYRRLDPGIAYNCKEGYGITASDSRKSLIHFLKHNVYERRDLHYALTIDQRKCYEHMTRKLYRKALKMLAVDTELVDFAVNVAFNGNSLPIGTPTSPFVHHVIMLAFDRWLGSVPGPKARYADDTLILFRTREEANRAAWRIRNFWWYTYGILAKRNPQIIDIDSSPLSFCGMPVVGCAGRFAHCLRQEHLGRTARIGIGVGGAVVGIEVARRAVRIGRIATEAQTAPLRGSRFAVRSSGSGTRSRCRVCRTVLPRRILSYRP